MRIIRPTVEVQLHYPEKNVEIEKFLERIGRTSYRSESKIKDGSAEDFLRSRKREGHDGIFEHSMATVFMQIDRGIANEYVRHRIASFMQESTRWCNYISERIGAEIRITALPPMANYPLETKKAITEFYIAKMQDYEDNYKEAKRLGAKNDIARYFLPLGLTCDFVMSANLRSWRHVFDQRCERVAHEGIRMTSFFILRELYRKIPVVFEDQYLEYLEGNGADLDYLGEGLISG